MSITSNFPAIKPTLLLDFSNTKQLDSRITFTRASTATYYDGVTTAKAEENFLLQSQDFATTWTTTSLNATITANTTAAPDGTTTADTLTDDATNGIHRVSQTVTTSNTLQMVYSVFAKYSTMQWISISAATGTGTWAGAKFDVQNGVLGSTSQQGTGFTANSSSITSVGNGWYRCVLIYTAGASGSTSMLVSGATDGTTFTTSQRGSEVYIGSGSAVFLWGAQLEQRSAVTAYTPTTTQAITNYVPQLLTAASGVARFDNNPTTFESLGLEIEESRTNLLVRSEEFQTTWTNIDSTEQTDVIVSPAGTLTGDKIVENSGSVVPYLSQSVSVTSGTAYTFSVYGKEDPTSAKRYLMLLLPSAQFGANIRVSVNLATGAVATSGSPTATSAAAVGNGWYRISVTASATATGSATIQVRLTNDANAGISAYTGDGYSGIYIWGAQLEAGAFATSYIPTVASQVTRAADAASMTGTNFSSWFNQGEGNLYAEGLLNNPAVTGAQTRRFVEMSDGTNNNKITFGRAADVNSAVRVIYTVSGVNINGTNGQPVVDIFPSAKVAVAYEAANYAFSPNGIPVTTSTAASVPVMNTLYIGNDSTISAAGSANGTIKKIAYYPLRVTDAQLQGLTS
jgi:hypothetical protein